MNGPTIQYPGKAEATQNADGTYTLRALDGTVLGTYENMAAAWEGFEEHFPATEEEKAAEAAYKAGQENAYLDGDATDDGEPTPEMRTHWERMKTDSDYAEGVRDQQRSDASYEHEQAWLYGQRHQL